MLISAGIHYPRAAPEMWPGLLAKAKDGGANAIQTYVFWSGHEPVKGQYYFSGRYNLVKFVKLVGEAGLFLHLRIGPYACAEWNFGGFPVWLRDIPGIVFRTNNTAFKEEMSTFVSMVVNLMKRKRLFSWQGGPIILAQIENEYGDVEHSFGEGGRQYVKWAAEFTQTLDAGVPWVMCQQNDAPSSIINACNGFYCDGFRPNDYVKPVLWTEDWNGWFTSWGDPIPQRPVEDNAFAIARFFQRGGSFHNYYMYFGGTNFGHTSGGPFVTTSYDYDAPIDEYGLSRQPKWGHFKELHAAIKLCEEALIAVNDEPFYMSLGPHQEAHVYGDFSGDQTMEDVLTGSGVCAAFLANIDTTKVATVQFNGQTFDLPPWSVSILPDCKKVAFNTAKVNAQTSLVKMGRASQICKKNPGTKFQGYAVTENEELSWTSYKEPIGVWSNTSFSSKTLLEHLSITKDTTDYLWYICRVQVSEDESTFLSKSFTQPKLHVEAMRDALTVFVNGNITGTATASTAESWVGMEQVVTLKGGENEIALLSTTVGLQNYGAFLEKDGAGIQGPLRLTGLATGDIVLTSTEWTYQIGLKGEFLKIFTEEGKTNVDWSSPTVQPEKTAVTWYKTYFDSPCGDDPVALDLGSMGKGEAWINGKSIGRYWPAFHAKNSSCSDGCDYRGTYNSNKCLIGCGQPTQRWYHVPRSWLKPMNNFLVLFEEIGGDVSQISVMMRYQDTVCAHISEFQPSTKLWMQSSDMNNGNHNFSGASELSIECREGYIIQLISFASFGNPYGGCRNFEQGHCHHVASKSFVEAACIGHQHCSIDVNVQSFGEDPCPGTAKSLAVEVVCSQQGRIVKGSNIFVADKDVLQGMQIQ